jgi:hypothetical protein
MKAQKHRPFGKLYPLPIPEAQWNIVSVDFITELSDSHGFDTMVVVVDLVSRQSYFIPTHTMVMALGSV